ncbi:MAG TPA: hypothetical protein VF322_13830 [Gammaproteobacteria bacterium]
MVHADDESRIEPPAEEGPSRRLGRVESDGRGRNIWRWARDLADSTSVLLKRLQSTDLELEPTRQVKVRIAQANRPAPRAVTAGPDLALEESGSRDAGGGFDPYNSR